MSADLDFQCRCGAVQGVCRDAGGSMGVRVVCYCTDCQAFACYLGAEEEYLDAAGGTDIYQTAPSRLEITQGLDRIKSVVLTANGLRRFYASCCRTPLANTIANRKLPFAGTFVRNYNADRREGVFGPVKAAVFFKFAQGEPLERARIALPLLVLDLMRRAMAEWISGGSKRNVYLDAVASGVIDAPCVVSAAERERLDVMAAEHAQRAVKNTGRG